jgi:superfamily I DNA/RNA helicase
MNRFFTDDEIKELVNSDNLEQILLNRLDWEDGEYYVNIGIHRRFNDNPNNIRVASMHKVKGAEADNVYCLLDATKKTTLRFQEDPDAELRVLYVAVTRAKKRLYIVTSNSKYGYPVEEIGQGVFA